MKKAYLLIALACISVYSCTKHYTTYTTYDSRDTTGFVVNGISDISLDSRDSIMIPMSVERVSGQEQKLTFSINNLPANVTAKFSPESGYNFGTTLTLVSKNAALGESNITINISDSTGAIVRSYDVTLTVEPKMFCTEEVIGNYMSHYMCTNDSDSTSSVIVPLTTSTGNSQTMVRITGLIPTFFGVVDAKLTCEGQKINIQNQNVGPFTIWGEGDFSKDSTVIVNYSYYDGVDTFHCTTEMKRLP